MRTLFETLLKNNAYCVVRGKNPVGEYEATLYRYVANHHGQRCAVKETTYYTEDLDDACGTAISMSNFQPITQAV